MSKSVKGISMNQTTKVKLLSLVIALIAIASAVIGLANGSHDDFEGLPDSSSPHGAAISNNEQIVDYVGSAIGLPDYTGDDVIEINGNVPQFSDADLSLPFGTENYSRFDDLGRAGAAIAVVGKDTMPKGKRQALQYKPTGWHQAFYDDSIGLDHLYERSHLLAHSLTAENDNPNNLITGTAYMNELMISYENQVARYIDRTWNHVLYRVTPIFQGSELVARGVQMEAYSIEDAGSGISFNVAIYNRQPKVSIDYKTGTSSLE